jgi:uncharacterized membrane protein
VCTLLGGAAMLSLVGRRFGPLDMALVALGLVAQVVAILHLARGFQPTRVIRNYRQVMRLNVASATALSAYLLTRLALTF